MDNKQKKPRTVEEILSDPRVKIIQSDNQEESFNAPKKTKTVDEILSDPRVKVTKEVDSSIGKQAKDFVSGFSRGATSNFFDPVKEFLAKKTLEKEGEPADSKYYKALKLLRPFKDTGNKKEDIKELVKLYETRRQRRDKKYSYDNIIPHKAGEFLGETITSPLTYILPNLGTIFNKAGSIKKGYSTLIKQIRQGKIKPSSQTFKNQAKINALATTMGAASGTLQKGGADPLLADLAGIFGTPLAISGAKTLGKGAVNLFQPNRIDRLAEHLFYPDMNKKAKDFLFKTINQEEKNKSKKIKNLEDSIVKLDKNVQSQDILDKNINTAQILENAELSDLLRGKLSKLKQTKKINKEFKEKIPTAIEEMLPVVESNEGKINYIRDTIENNLSNLKKTVKDADVYKKSNATDTDITDFVGKIIDNLKNNEKPYSFTKNYNSVLSELFGKPKTQHNKYIKSLENIIPQEDFIKLKNNYDILSRLDGNNYNNYLEILKKSSEDLKSLEKHKGLGADVYNKLYKSVLSPELPINDLPINKIVIKGETAKDIEEIVKNTANNLFTTGEKKAGKNYSDKIYTPFVETIEKTNPYMRVANEQYRSLKKPISDIEDSLSLPGMFIKENVSNPYSTNKYYYEPSELKKTILNSENEGKQINQLFKSTNNEKGVKDRVKSIIVEDLIKSYSPDYFSTINSPEVLDKVTRTTPNKFFNTLKKQEPNRALAMEELENKNLETIADKLRKFEQTHQGGVLGSPTAEKTAVISQVDKVATSPKSIFSYIPGFGNVVPGISKNEIKENRIKKMNNYLDTFFSNKEFAKKALEEEKLRLSRNGAIYAIYNSPNTYPSIIPAINRFKNPREK